MSDSDEEYDPAAVAPRVETPMTTTRAPGAGVAGSAPSPTHATADAPDTVVASAGATSASLPSQDASSSVNLIHATVAEFNREGGLRLQGIKGAVRSLCLNSSATTLCASGQDGQLCMWDFTVPLTYRRLQPTRVLTPFVNRIAGLQPIVSVHCACDDSYFVACQDGDCPVLISASGRQMEMCAMGERGVLDVVKCKAHRAPVTCSAPHPSTAAAFFTGSQDGTARRWDANAVTRGSTFAVKHGSGQITDKVIVESVCGLRTTGSGHVFASGGEDGCVQLWDARVKYRPGGSVNRWDLYRTGPVTAGGSFMESDGFFSTTHIGGLVELETAGAAPVLAVRAGDAIHCLDLRTPKGNAVRRVADVIKGLPNARDTTPLAAGREPGSFYACTGHEGFHGKAGGHVVGFSCTGTSTAMPPTSLWRAGSGEKEDVLCVAVDRARSSGSCFAGLEGGDVVVQLGADPGQPILSWLATRPGSDSHGNRTLGQKSTRADALSGDDDEPLF